MWNQYNRIIKDNAPILLFAQTPFDKVLGSSNLSMLKYEWIWEKTQATGHLNAKKMPMKAHENILVFYKKLPIYNPQKTTGHKPIHSYTKYIKIYSKDKKLLPKDGDKITILNAQLASYRGNMQIIIHKQSDFKVGF